MLDLSPMSDPLSQDSVALLNEIKTLMTLKGENPFKIRAFEKAAASLADRADLRERALAKTLKEIPGVGKGIEDVLTEFILQGRSTVRDELEQSFPEGFLELAGVPGLGPKKAMQLIEELDVHTLGELEYACRENRLIRLKGFGEKLQKKIFEGVQFIRSNQGFWRLAELEEVASSFLQGLQKEFPQSRVSETGELRRKLEVVQQFDYLIEVQEGELLDDLRQKAHQRAEAFRRLKSGLPPIHFHFARSQEYAYQLAKTTGTAEHWKALIQMDSLVPEGSVSIQPASSEESSESLERRFFHHVKLPWIPPECRETGEEIQLARSGELDRLLPWNGIRGVFHNHTIRSDGMATLEEMVIAAKKLGYEYLGISDHSQSAFYAQGLKESMLREQEAEVREVQKKYPDFKIFWGIESDILADGSLDYDDEVLRKFDFVIASVHSRFNMDREAMTQRILKAIRNPYTRFLGHVTGRLLLGRPGYDVDMVALIREAAQRGVAIELNSNPARLDIDWRWGSEMRKWKTFTSINPDAHEVSGLKDTRHGVAMARKALLSANQVVNTRSASEVAQWLRRN